MSDLYPTLSPTVWNVDKYSPSPGVESFQALPRYGSSGFPSDNISGSEYWINIAVSAGIPIACFIIGLVVYWFFLCCRNGCCSSCCNSCNCWKIFTDIFFGCGCKQLCCPSVDPESALHTGNYLKSPDHCIHNPICKGRPLNARLTLIIIFFTVGMVNIQVDNALVDVRKSFREVADICVDIGGVFQSFSDEAGDIKVSAGNISTAATSLELECDYDEIQDAASDIVTYADDTKSAAKKIEQLIGSLPKTMNDIADKVRNVFSGKTYTRVRFSLMFGVAFCLVGFFGAICWESDKLRILQCSSCILALTAILGLLLMFILAFVIAVETGTGLVISDFCHANPADVLTTLAKEELDGDPAKTVKFFLTCNQTNPADQYYQDALTYVDDINQTLSEMRVVATQEFVCCDADDIDSYSSLESMNDACYASDCTTLGGTCQLPNLQPGYCLAGAGCPATDYDTVQDSVVYLLGEDGPLNGIYDLLTCKTVNKPVTRLLNVALCDHAISGIYLLWETHVGVLIAIYFSIILISYLRQAIVGKPCFGDLGDSDLGEDDPEDSKPDHWYPVAPISIPSRETSYDKNERDDLIEPPISRKSGDGFIHN